MNFCHGKRRQKQLRTTASRPTVSTTCWKRKPISQWCDIQWLNFRKPLKFIFIDPVYCKRKQSKMTSIFERRKFSQSIFEIQQTQLAVFIIFLSKEILEVLHHVFRNPVLFYIHNHKGKSTSFTRRGWGSWGGLAWRGGDSEGILLIPTTTWKKVWWGGDWSFLPDNVWQHKRKWPQVALGEVSIWH